MPANRISRTLSALLTIGLFGGLVYGVARTWRTDAAVPTLHAPGAPTAVRRMFESGLDSLVASLEALGTSMDRPGGDAARVAFRRARVAYKRIEFLLTFYSPTMVAVVNGPADGDDPDAPPAPPGTRAGFGVVEAALFGDAGDTTGARQARRAVTTMLTSVRALRAATGLLTIGDTSALDAMRLELARVMTTGIAGFDSDESGDAIVESAAALDGIRDGLSRLTTTGFAPERLRAFQLLGDAARTLRASPGFDAFDRFAFVSSAGIPAAQAVLAVRQAIDPAPPASRRLWQSSAATPFDTNAFDPWALAPEYAPRASPDVTALGRRLFADSRLSGPGTRSCASCHAPTHGFADARARAAPIAGAGHAPLRNTPTLVNAALQPAMFADERAGFVEDQIRIVLSSPAEMASSPALAAKRTGLDERTVRVALAAYIRTLTALDSRFDRAIRGDTSAIRPDERRGFNLFAGKARCGTCHFAPLFGGPTPPDFTRSELEIVGVPRTPVTRAATVDPDSGRERVDHWSEHRFAFRVPTVRNVALTAPYMHNGVYDTLEQVVDFYDRGGGVGIGESLASQSLPARPLHLTSRERADLVAFLRSLTDSSATVSKP